MLVVDPRGLDRAPEPMKREHLDLPQAVPQWMFTQQRSNEFQCRRWIVGLE